MKIAVIGTGISGLAAAHLLSRRFDVSVFEAGAAVGGHTATVDVELHGKKYAIDTGFIVYNDWTYPNFIKLMAQLGVENQPTEMGFSVRDARDGFEYCGSNFSGLFAQRRNLLNLKFWRMLADVMRFNREAAADLAAGHADDSTTLGDYLDRHGYGNYFVDRFLVPMGAAIWSASTRNMREFPLLFFLRFCQNHGLLSVNDRPQWRVIRGGSRNYLTPLCAPFAERIYTATPITAVRRHADGVDISSERFGKQRFEQVVIAAHSDQALAMLADPLPAEREVLGAIPYQNNEVILHTDASILPRSRRAWASWNYHLTDDEQPNAVLTYNMNMLQGIDAPETFCVTLNHTDAIAPSKILRRFDYAHPVFSRAGIAAQKRWSEINGVNRTWYCGAYWRNGFHEDGLTSALWVCEAFGERL